MTNKELPMLVKRCLAHGVTILPVFLSGIMDQYERKRIPDNDLSTMLKKDLETYVRGLYKSSCEMAGDWTEGHRILKGLGFVEQQRKDGHRVFISLVWEGKAHD